MALYLSSLRAKGDSLFYIIRSASWEFCECQWDLLTWFACLVSLIGVFLQNHGWCRFSPGILLLNAIIKKQKKKHFSCRENDWDFLFLFSVQLTWRTLLIGFFCDWIRPHPSFSFRLLEFCHVIPGWKALILVAPLRRKTDKNMWILSHHTWLGHSERVWPFHLFFLL